MTVKTGPYTAGKNIAIKVPEHEYHDTVRFYREILGLEDAFDYDPMATSAAVKFGSNILWIDRVTTLSQAEIWLEILSNDISTARKHLTEQGLQLRESIEPLPIEIEGFWVAAPGNLIHLIRKST